MTSTMPNPTGALVLCSVCRVWSTFQPSGVCTRCANKGGSESGADKHREGDR